MRSHSYFLTSELLNKERKKAGFKSQPSFKKMIKLIVSDFDGTLVPLGREVEKGLDAEAKAILVPYVNKDAVVIATGRHPSFIAKIIPDLNFETIIGFSGNLTMSRGELSGTLFSAEELKRIYQYYSDRKDKLQMYCCSRDNVFYFSSYQCEERKRREEIYKTRICDINGISDELIGELVERQAEIICRIVFKGVTESLLDSIKEEFEALFPEYNLVKTGGAQLEVRRIEISKASEILKLIKQKGIREDEVAVMGDSDNDMEMLKYFSNSFYLGKDNSELAELAKYRCSSLVEALKIIQKLGGEYD